MNTPATAIQTRKAGVSLAAWALFAGLLIVYNSNLDFLPGDDATPNVYLPLSLLDDGSLTFSPENFPFMFRWQTQEAKGSDSTLQPIVTNGWPPEIRNWPQSIGHDLNSLVLEREQYYLIPSQREGQYSSTFGIGAGLFALPLFALANLIVDFSSTSPQFAWYLGKLAASMAVAGSAVLVLLVANRYCGLKSALLIALAYGFGTCVWSISSQTLWQHGPNELFLALGAYFWLKTSPTPKDWVCCGLAWGLAVLCRPTSALVVAIMGAWLVGRTCLARMIPGLAFLLGSLPVAVLLAMYNWHYLGRPFAFGQSARGYSVAHEKTGSPELWQAPLFEGLAGLLFSPSRGLFVYSPFLILAVFGVYRIWREREYARSILPCRWLGWPASVSVVCSNGF